MTLIIKDPSKGKIIRNFMPITLINKGLKIWANVLAKRLARVVDRLFREM